jgi:hypothetical protein
VGALNRAPSKLDLPEGSIDPFADPPQSSGPWLRVPVVTSGVSPKVSQRTGDGGRPLTCSSGARRRESENFYPSRGAY